jgi:tetratricopeptide (TPR) repeat protein
MIDPERVLSPLDEEQKAVDRLATYESSTELADALRSSWRAFERSLRHLLRGDSEAPNELRMSALSPADLPIDRLIAALSRRNLISLRLAGMTHEMEQAAKRAEGSDVRAADGDAALATIAQLRTEVYGLGDQPVRAAAHKAVEEGAIEESAQEVPSSGGERSRGGLIVTALVLIASAAFLVIVLRRGDSMSEGMAEFRAGRHAIAEREFRQALADDNENVTARLYLGRIYRIEGRYDEAATVLREAARFAPRDAAVHRELGYLFLDLGSAGSAVSQFRQAQEIDPEDKLNWIGLIRALRAAGDPEADAVLERAPAEVRAALTSNLPPPDTL